MAVALLGEADGEDEDGIDAIDEGDIESDGAADGEAIPDGVAIPDGDALLDGEADEDALPVTATLVMLVHSIGRKYRVGLPFARI